MTDTYDIIVIGAGPAGSSAARAAAQKGAKVLLLDRKEEVGVPERCGGGLFMSSIPDFLDISGFTKYQIVERVWFYAPDLSHYTIPTKNIDSYMLSFHRKDFDQWLLELAINAGAEFRNNTLVTGLNFDTSNRVKGVTCTCDGKIHTYHAKVVIGADGVEMHVGRWAGIQKQVPSRFLSPTYLKIIEGLPLKDEDAYIYFLEECQFQGYAWIFPKGNSVFNVGLGIHQEYRTEETIKQVLDRFLDRSFGTCKILHEHSGGVNLKMPLERPVGDGVLLAGDSAWHVDPSTGGGIYSALLAGNKAGQVAVDALNRGDTSAASLHEYVDYVKKTIFDDYMRLYRFKRRFGMLSNNTANRATHLMKRVPERARNKATIVACIFFANPLNFFKGMLIRNKDITG